MLTIASLIAIAYLPGAILFRLPVGDRAKRASLPADERVFWSVIISIGITTTVALLLAAMRAYTLIDAGLVQCGARGPVRGGVAREPAARANLAQAGLDCAVAGGAHRRKHVDVLRGTRG